MGMKIAEHLNRSKCKGNTDNDESNKTMCTPTKQRITGKERWIEEAVFGNRKTTEIKEAHSPPGQFQILDSYF